MKCSPLRRLVESLEGDGGLCLNRGQLDPVQSGKLPWGFRLYRGNMPVKLFFFFFFLKNFFYGSRVDLRCCVNFGSTPTWFSYTYLYSFCIPFHGGVSQDSEQFPVQTRRTLFIHPIHYSFVSISWVTKKQKKEDGAEYPNVDCLKVLVLNLSHLAASRLLSVSASQSVFIESFVCIMF